MIFPVTLYHPDSKNPDKVLRARHAAELDGLLKIGWKIRAPYAVIDGKSIGRLIEAEASE